MICINFYFFPINFILFFFFSDRIKLIVQFFARNGYQLLTSLTSEGARNSQFDFLKSIHDLFYYFTKLVEQYTKILLSSK